MLSDQKFLEKAPNGFISKLKHRSENEIDPTIFEKHKNNFYRNFNTHS